MKALALLLSLVACAHHVGDVCHSGDAYCGDKLNPKSALSCKDGKLAHFDCPGPNGCVEDEKRAASCDQSSGATAGGLCFPEYEGTGHCSADGLGYLFCAHGSWKEIFCAQGAACVTGRAGVSCQTPLPQVK